MTPAATSIRKLIALLHLASPALPIGTFSYSQGLEGAVDAQLVHDAESAQAWIQSGLEHVLAINELPMLSIIYGIWESGNFSEIERLNARFLASRESSELRQETEQMGWSLTQLALALRWHDEARQVALRSLRPVCLPTAFAYASGALGIDRESCVSAYCFSWVENQVTAALKSVPSGPERRTENPVCHAPGDSRRGTQGYRDSTRSDLHLCTAPWDTIGAARDPVFAAVSLVRKRFRFLASDFSFTLLCRPRVGFCVHEKRR